jgi:UDP-glucuronate decarboxylase
MTKRILVTGGAGFLGFHLCERLLREGFHVICLDNFFTGSEKNTASLLKRPQFELLQHDICYPLAIQVDEIYNLACPASPVHYQKNPIKTIMTSVQGAINMLELADRTQAKILQASTSEVYGDPEVHPQRENYWGHVNPIGIRSCYDEGKRCAESLFFAYHQKRGVKIKVVRIFNTYGPRMDREDGRVVSNFILQALQGKDITVNGDGSQTRSFCYVDDLIEGIVQMMGSKDDFTGPVNLGNPQELSVLKLAELIIDLTRSKSKIVNRPMPSDDPIRRCPDIFLAREKLNWEPKIPLSKGLMKTIEYFRGLSQ